MKNQKCQNIERKLFNVNYVITFPADAMQNNFLFSFDGQNIESEWVGNVAMLSITKVTSWPALTTNSFVEYAILFPSGCMVTVTLFDPHPTNANKQINIKNFFIGFSLIKKSNNIKYLLSRIYRIIIAQIT